VRANWRVTNNRAEPNATAKRSGVVAGLEDHKTHDVGQNTHVGDESGDENANANNLPSE